MFVLLYLVMRLNGCKCVITSSQNYMSFKSRINRLIQQKDHQLACTLWGLYNKEVFFCITPSFTWYFQETYVRTF